MSRCKARYQVTAAECKLRENTKIKLTYRCLLPVGTKNGVVTLRSGTYVMRDGPLIVD